MVVESEIHLPQPKACTQKHTLKLESDCHPFLSYTKSFIRELSEWFKESGGALLCRGRFIAQKPDVVGPPWRLPLRTFESCTLCPIQSVFGQGSPTGRKHVQVLRVAWCSPRTVKVCNPPVFESGSIRAIHRRSWLPDSDLSRAPLVRASRFTVAARKYSYASPSVRRERG